MASHGSKIMAGDKEAGEVTSSAEIVVDGIARRVALGYLKRGSAEQAESVHIDGHSAGIVPLPFEFAAV